MATTGVTFGGVTCRRHHLTAAADEKVPAVGGLRHHVTTAGGVT